MKLQDFIDEEFDDLDLYVKATSFDEAGDLRLLAQYGSNLQRDNRWNVELRFIEPIEIAVTVGYVGTIAQHTHHPLLAEHCEPHAQVFFSSAPRSPETVFYLAHRILSRELDGWRNPSAYLNGTPDELSEHLVGGFGLLASGPLSAMSAVAEAVGPLLTVRVIESKTVRDAAVAITFDRGFVICKSVEVLRNDG